MTVARDRMREGLTLFQSGFSTHRALIGGARPADAGQEWFRLDTNLSLTAPSAAERFGFWHWTTMIGLAGTAGLLLLAQVVRARRVSAILDRVGPSIGSKTAAHAAPPPSSLAEEVPPKRVEPERKAWRGTLKVVQVMRETPSVKTFRLAEPSGALLPFAYLPGQFMSVAAEVAPGKIARRAYTIASSPTQRAYAELTIKREEHGAVSLHLHDHVSVGDLLQVEAPYGAFTFDGLDEDSIVLIGGGVGITPMMAVIRFLTDRSWPGEIHFVYAARSTEELVFRDELAYLQRRHPRLHVVAVVATRSEGIEWFGPEGFVTKELLASAVPHLQAHRIHLCGPPPMMEAVKAALADLGVPADRVHTESFGPGMSPPGELSPHPPGAADLVRFGNASAASGPKSENLAPAAASVLFSKSRKTAPLAGGATVLEAAEAVGVEIPFSCRVGVCGICKVRLLQGEVVMDVEDGLAPGDKAAGLVLACQARASSSTLNVEA